MQTRSIVEKIKRNTWCFSLLEKQAKLKLRFAIHQEVDQPEGKSQSPNFNQKSPWCHIVRVQYTSEAENKESTTFKLIINQTFLSKLFALEPCKCNVINAPQFTGAGGSFRGRLQFETYGCKEIPECFRDWQRGFLRLLEFPHTFGLNVFVRWTVDQSKVTRMV